MNTKMKVMALLAMILLLLVATTAMAKNSPETEKQITGLQTMCDGSATDRSQRQEQKSLYQRLGGYDKILKFTTEVVRLHDLNESIMPMLVNVDNKMLAKHVADFVAAGTGGTTEYTGRPMPAAHAHLGLTDADFLSAGGDIVTAMNTMGYGQNEIDEMLCILLSLKDQVVFK